MSGANNWADDDGMIGGLESSHSFSLWMDNLWVLTLFEGGKNIGRSPVVFG